MKKNNKKGFTLAELLIVVAIIAVLTAIAIPVFTSQLERSREATDMSNIRAAYAEVVSDYLSAGAKAAKSAKVATIKQTVNGWVIDHDLTTRVSGTEKTYTVPAIDATTNASGIWVVISATGDVSVVTSDPGY